jgi:hypothetical protein
LFEQRVKHMGRRNIKEKEIFSAQWKPQRTKATSFIDEKLSLKKLTNEKEGGLEVVAFGLSLSYSRC